MPAKTDRFSDFVRGPDRRSDIFSLGVVMYEMLSSERCLGNPQSVESLMDEVKGVKITPIRSLRPDSPPQVEAVLGRMMAVSPEDRYANAAEVERALARAQGTTLRPARLPA